MSDINKLVTENIIRHMVRLHKQPAWLADQSGVSRAQISRLLSGAHGFSLETLEKIADALDLPVSALLSKPEEVAKIAEARYEVRSEEFAKIRATIDEDRLQFKFKLINENLDRLMERTRLAGLLDSSLEGRFRKAIESDPERTEKFLSALESGGEFISADNVPTVFRDLEFVNSTFPIIDLIEAIQKLDFAAKEDLRKQLGISLQFDEVKTESLKGSVDQIAEGSEAPDVKARIVKLGQSS